MDHHLIRDLKSKELAPGVVLRSAYLDKVMVTFVNFEDGAAVPLHSHPHEQISVMISGSLRFQVGGEEKKVNAGEVVLIPSGIQHEAQAIGGPAVAYDSWSPIREDYVLDRRSE